MSASESKGAWTRIHAGWYRYTNAAGIELAYIERYRSFWNIRVLPCGDQAAAFDLTASPKTMREARKLAEIAYKHTSRKLIEEGYRPCKIR